MASRVEFTHNSLGPNLKKFTPLLNRNIYQVLRFHEPQLRTAAKHDAPWVDRTTNARSGLDAVVTMSQPHVYELVLFHKVSYGIWLEIRWSGKYATIMPTIRWYAPRVWKSYHKLLDRMNIEKGSVVV